MRLRVIGGGGVEGGVVEEGVVGGGGVDGELVTVEEGGVVDGAVVVDLAPAGVEEAEDASGAEGEVESSGNANEAAAFAANGVEEITREVEGVMVKLDGDGGGAREEAFVNTADFGPAALDAAERIVHGDVVGRAPVFAHEDDVAGVEGAIELG